MSAYERRYRRQLRDQGVATAIAQHDPQALDQVFRDQAAPAYDRSKKWW